MPSEKAQYLVLQIFSVTFPFFALVLCGYVAARRGFLPLEAIAGLNGFVLFFALPCMLFRFGATTPIAQLLDVGVFLIWLVCAIVMVAFTIAMSLNRRIRWNDASFGALVAAFPNSGFMGVPLLVALLGPAAAGPVICCILADMIVTSSLCVGLAQAQGSSSAGVRVAVGRALRGALSNPLPWAVGLGAVGSWADMTLLEPVATIVRMLGDSATPVALFTIGAVLWRAGQHAHSRTPVRRYLPVALIKLLLHPLLVFTLAALAHGLGAALSVFQITVLTLAAALPSASNVSLLAERYGADNGRIARIILSSTALAFVSFTLLAWGLGAAPAV